LTAVSWLAVGAAALLVRPPARGRVRAAALRARAGPSAGTSDAGRHRRRAGVEPDRSPGARLASWAATAVVGAGACLAAGAAIGVTSALAVLGAARLVRASRRRRTARQLERQVLTAVRTLVADLESGSAPAAALGAAAAAAPGFEEAFRRAARAAGSGGEVAAAFAAEPALQPLGHAWALADHAGAPLVDTLAGVAADLAACADRRHAVAVALAGPRSTAVLLAGLPALGLLLGAAMGAHPLSFLFDSTAGHLVWCAALLLDGLGIAWTERLLRSAER
jgi:tight adherence protein B